MFQIESLFSTAFNKPPSAVAITPNLRPGTPCDFEMLFITTKFGYSTKISSSIKVVASSAKSPNDSSMINLILRAFAQSNTFFSSSKPI